MLPVQPDEAPPGRITRWRPWLARAVALGVMGLVATGCGGDQLDPEVKHYFECVDGHWTQTPDESCDSRGGYKDPSTQRIRDSLETMPSAGPGDAYAYRCWDGWVSYAVGKPGACSWHGGVASLIHPDVR